MTHPLGFRMTLTDGTPRQCDVCTSPINGPRIETHVGGSYQSALCLDCAADAAAIVAPPTVTATVLDETPAELHVCEDCGRTFARAASLGSHRRVHEPVAV